MGSKEELATDWFIRFGVYGGMALGLAIGLFIGIGWWTVAMIVICLAFAGYSIFRACTVSALHDKEAPE